MEGTWKKKSESQFMHGIRLYKILLSFRDSETIMFDSQKNTHYLYDKIGINKEKIVWNGPEVKVIP